MKGAMNTEKVNLASKLTQLSDHWKPRTVARLNDYDLRQLFVAHHRRRKGIGRRAVDALRGGLAEGQAWWSAVVVVSGRARGGARLPVWGGET